MNTHMQPTIANPVARSLYNALMGEIEPDLRLDATEATAAKLAAMSPEERRIRVARYEEAYATFHERWPKFVEESKERVKLIMKMFRSFKEHEDDRATDILEQSLNSFPSAS